MTEAQGQQMIDLLTQIKEQQTMMHDQLSTFLTWYSDTSGVLIAAALVTVSALSLWTVWRLVAGRGG